MRNPAKTFINKEKELIAISEKIYKDYKKNRVFIHDIHTFNIIFTSKSFKNTINNISFHPSYNIVAIATGDYDGGWCYCGNIIIWDYVANTYEEILSNNIEVLSCHFNEDGSLLTFTTTPEDEDDRLFSIRRYQIVFPPSKKIDLMGLREIDIKKFSEKEYLKEHNKQDIEVLTLLGL